MKTKQGSKFKVQLLFSLFTIVAGFMLLVYMIVKEDEPGAVPPLLILAGMFWYYMIRSRIRYHQADSSL